MSEKGWIILGVLGLIVIGILLGLWGTYNGLVGLDTNVENAKAHVQSAYQRRADLIPNLVATVQGSADFEKSTLVELTAMRSQAGSYQQQMKSATTLQEMQTVDNGLGGVLARLMVVVEAYPQIRSTEAFMSLQSQIEGTENRINYERNNYNDAVQQYKIGVRTFPNVLIAGMFGFSADKWSMFEATSTAQNAPTVTFNFNTPVSV